MPTITWNENKIGDLESNTFPKIWITGSLSSSIPPHAYWIYMSEMNLHSSKNTIQECMDLAEKWIKDISDSEKLYTLEDYDKEE